MGGPILEVGSFCGLSTAILTEDGAEVTCIDPFLGGEDLPERNTYETFEANLRSLGRFEQTTVLRKKSKDAFPYLDDDRFRLVFIDGSHEYLNVLFDILEGYRVLKPGGWLVVDDFNWGERLPVLNALIASGYRWNIVHETKLAEIRK